MKFRKIIFYVVTVFSLNVVFVNYICAESTGTQKNINIPYIETQKVELKIPTKDSLGIEIKESFMLKAIAAALETKNKYNPQEQSKKRFLFDIWDIKYFSFKVAIKDNSFVVNYKNALKVKTRTMGGSVNESDKQASTFEFQMPFKITRNENYFSIIVDFPQKGLLTESDEVGPIDTTENLIADAQRLYKELPNLKMVSHSMLTVEQLQKRLNEIKKSDKATYEFDISIGANEDDPSWTVTIRNSKIGRSDWHDEKTKYYTTVSKVTTINGLPIIGKNELPKVGDVFFVIYEPKRREGIKFTNITDFLEILEEIVTRHQINGFRFDVMSEGSMSNGFYRIRDIRLIEN